MIRGLESLSSLFHLLGRREGWEMELITPYDHMMKLPQKSLKCLENFWAGDHTHMSGGWCISTPQGQMLIGWPCLTYIFICLFICIFHHSLYYINWQMWIKVSLNSWALLENYQSWGEGHGSPQFIAGQLKVQEA